MQMIMYDAADLEAMLEDLESDVTERKESFTGDAPMTVREAICAFANDLPDYRRPGVVFVGAKNNGEASGLAITDQLLVQLAGIRDEGQITPPPTMTVTKHTLRGGEMAVITVQPTDSPPVRYKGRVHVRIGPRRSIATAQDERILNEKRRHHDKPFDIQPVRGSSLNDLNKVTFESQYLPAAVAPDVLVANERTYEQRLAATKMIAAADDPIPTLIGLVVLGNDIRSFVPCAYLQFLRVAGLDLADPIIDELEINGTVQEALLRVDDKLISHNRSAVEFTSGSVETVKQLYPMVALQQLVRNAVMHRTYEATNTPVRIHWFDDRIEIVNPGGPFGAVTAQNFGQPGVTDYRNPNLAEALRVLGFVQRYGAGLPTARRSLEGNGNPPPQFTLEANFVHVLVKPAP